MESKHDLAEIDAQLKYAIGHKRLIQLTYGGGTRVAEPHDYGLQKGAPKLLAYQRRRDGNTGGRSAIGWRLFDVTKIEHCLVLADAFEGSRGASHQQHYVWDVLYARVT